jgi:hypothetical protein
MGIAKRERLLVIATLICVGLLVTDRFVIGPLWNVWAERSARIRELKKEIADGEPLVERQDAMRTRWGDMKNRALPVDVSVAEGRLLGALTDWSHESGLHSSSFKTQWTTHEDWKEIEIQTAARGDIRAFRSFLESMRKDEIPVRLKSIEISSREDNGRDLSIRATFSSIVLNVKKENQ